MQGIRRNKEAIDEVNNFVKAYNKEVCGYHTNWYLIITSGDKRKRFSIWQHEAKRYMGRSYPDSKNKSHLCITTFETMLSDIMTILSEFPQEKSGIYVKIKCDFLISENIEIPEEKIVPFGKYKGINVDQLKEIDEKYYDWLLITMFKSFDENEDYSDVKFRKYVVENLVPDQRVEDKRTYVERNIDKLDKLWSILKKEEVLDDEFLKVFQPMCKLSDQDFQEYKEIRKNR